MGRFGRNFKLWIHRAIGNFGASILRPVAITPKVICRIFAPLVCCYVIFEGCGCGGSGARTQLRSWEGLYTVSFPGPSTRQTQHFKLDSGDVEGEAYSYRNGTTTYQVLHYRFPKGVTVDPIATYDGVEKGQLEKLGGRLLKQVRFSQDEIEDGRELTIALPDDVEIHERLVVAKPTAKWKSRGTHYYQIQVTHPRKGCCEADIYRFLKSFKLDDSVGIP